MAKYNKKILCFIDESGSAGQPGFCLGCVFLWSSECGKADKIFSDMLPQSINEVHSVLLEDQLCRSLLSRFYQSNRPGDMIFINKSCDDKNHCYRTAFANDVLATVKIGARRFEKLIQRGKNLRNIDVIIDQSQTSLHQAFKSAIHNRCGQNPFFRGVNDVVSLDSSASRMLQLADLVAYSRCLSRKLHINNKQARHTFGVEYL